MKILLLSPASSIHTVRWAKAFHERGCTVHIVSLPDHHLGKDKLCDGITVHYLKIGGTKGYYLNAAELRKLTKEIKPSIINAHYASGYGTLARKARIHPLVLNVWGSDIFEFPRRNFICEKVIIKNLKNAEQISSTSNAMAEEVKRVLKKETTPITVVPFGVDIDTFSPKNENCSDNRYFTFGSIKGLSPIYGMEYLVKAFALVVNRWTAEGKESPEPHMFLCGAGQPTDLEVLSSLRAELHLEHMCEIQGPIPHDQVPSKLSSFNACCFASIVEESFGVSLIEAMACELPVIATDAVGFKEVVDDGVTGFIVQKGDEKALADKMWELFKNEDRCKKLGKNGRDRVIKYYNWEDNVTDMLSVLERTSQVKRKGE